MSNRRPSDEQVRELLASLPSPAIPDAVTARIRRSLQGDVVPLRPDRNVAAMMVAAAVAAVVMLVAVVVRPTGSQPPPLAQASPPVVHAGAVYEPTTLVQTVRERLGLRADPGTPQPGTFLATADGLRDCLTALQAQGALMMADVGTYAQNPAVVLVTRYIPHRSFIEVWVVERSCGRAGTGLRRHVLAAANSG